MDFAKRVFWNSEEHRLRALWRLILQLVVFGVVMIGAGIAIGVIGAVWFLVEGSLSPDQLSDSAAVQSLLLQSPLFMLFNHLAVGLAMTLSIWGVGRFVDRRPFRGFGFHFNRAWWIDLGFGMALGAGLMGVIFLIELAAGWVTVTGTFITRAPEAGFLPALLVPLVSFLLVGFYEELFSRGYQLQNLAEGFGAFGARGAILAATVVSSAVFGILHATNPNASLFSTFNIVIAGVFLAMGYILTGELAIPIGLHITWNFFQGNVFGFPVSGGDFRSATFIAIDQRGPDLWTGGAFGPEAGLLGLAAIILGIGLTILWVRVRTGTVGLHLPLAAPPVSRSASE